MKKKLLVISCLGLAFFTLGCNRDKGTALEKMRSRSQAEATIKEVQKLEDDMRRTQELEKLEKQSQKIIDLQEPAKPPAE